MRRRSSPVHQHVDIQAGSSIEMVKSGSKSELYALKREKNALIQEIARLQEDHLTTAQQMNTLNERIQSAEERQRQLVSFLANMIQNPTFLAQLKHWKQQRRIGCTRIKRKFLKQQDLTAPCSPSGLSSIKHGAKELLPFFLSEDIESSGQDLFEGSSEVGMGVGPLVSDHDNNVLGSAQCLVSFPVEVIAQDKMSADDAILQSRKLFAPSGEHECLAPLPFAEDHSCEEMFMGNTESPEDIVGRDGLWDVVALDAGESSSYSGYCAAESLIQESNLWDFDLHTLEGDFRLDKYVMDGTSAEERGIEAPLAAKNPETFAL